MQEKRTMTAFAASDRIAAGDPVEVALAAKKLVDTGDERTILIFDDTTGRQEELDLRGSVAEIQARLATGPGAVGAAPEVADTAATKRPPGRPKLGVVGREVTLLPRHWEWLNAQPGGASVALRKLVEKARRDNAGPDRVRRSQEATFHFLSALAGNEPGFEEASRALFAGDAESFDRLAAQWPPDVGEYARGLARGVFQK